MLTAAEEQVMKHLWRLRTCFMRELLDAFPEPKPAKTTVATLLKRMVDKDLVGYKTYGNSREYFPKISKTAYFGRRLTGMVQDFFSDNPTELASLFAERTELTREQLEELQRIVNQQLEEE